MMAPLNEPLSMCLLEYIGRDGQQKEGHFDHSMIVSKLPTKGSIGKGAYVKSGNEFPTELVFLDESKCELHILDTNGKRAERATPVILIIEREEGQIVGMDMTVADSPFCARFGVVSKSVKQVAPELHRFVTYDDAECDEISEFEI